MIDLPVRLGSAGQKRRESHYTPRQWIEEMTPVIVQILVAMAALIYAESAILHLR